MTDVCDCGARGGGARWLDMKETTAHTRARAEGGVYQHLRVRDSTAAAATWTWLDMARC